MNDRPTRATTAGQRYLDLRRLASQTGRATDELQQLYALEGFLDRLGRSRHARRLVLKVACSSLPTTHFARLGTSTSAPTLDPRAGNPRPLSRRHLT